MSKLILIRHAAPRIVSEMPPFYWHLSAEGKESCQRLAKALTPYAPFEIYTSRELKARETGKIVAECLSLSCHVDETFAFYEHRRSGTFHQVKQQFNEEVEAFFANPSEMVFGDETADSAFERFDDSIDSLQRYKRNTDLAIVAHGRVMALYLSRHFGLDAFAVWQSLGLPSYAVIEDGKLLELVKEVT